MKYYGYIFLFIFSLTQGISSQYVEKTTTKKEKTAIEQQTKTNENQVIGKYRWPLDINNGYSSAFQEFRSNHFHAGMDLRTHQKTGYPVYAIADGTIYKIRMVKRGSGRGLYLKHDDGKTSIYFHLDRFEKKLEDLLKRVQRLKKQKYFGNYFLQKPLRYKRGQIIGYSGETGSGFPHLHLEIRDKHYFAVNPFKLIQLPAKDNNFPVLKKLLIRNREHASINGTIGETLIKFQKKSSGYYIAPKTFLITGSFDAVLNVYDVADTGKTVVPYSISVFIDDIHYFQLNFDRFKRDDNNQLGFVYDMYYSGSGSYFFNLFSQEGFVLEKQNEHFPQVIKTLDYGKHILRVMVTDNYNNTSTGVVPFYKVQQPEFKISNLKKGETGDKLSLDIEKLLAEPSASREIKISVFDIHNRKISSGTLHYDRITQTKALILKGVSDEAAYIDFDFYAYKVLYFKKRCLIENNHLTAFTDIDFDAFLNRDEVFIKVNHKDLSSRELALKVVQGGESQPVESQCSSDYIYFRFKPLNLANQVSLHFSILKDDKKVVEIQKKLELIYLKPGSKQTYKYNEFEAYFGVRSVYEAKVLRVEERNYKSEYPVLSRQISLSPYYFPFLDKVFYKFKKKLSNPQQVGIFKYNSFTGKWRYKYTTYDPGTATYKRRLISSGVFALLRDIFPPKVWFIRPGSSYKRNLKRLIVKITDKGKGVNDNSIKVWLNGQRICTGYDCRCEYDADRNSLTIAELGNLKAGKNLLKVQVNDYAGNRTTRAYSFSLK
jgi:hypothetical protein